jgi:hypothetical protein
MPKGIVALLAVLLAVGLSFGVALAEVSTFVYNVPSTELRNSGASVYFGIKGFGTSTDSYYPVLPTKKVSYEIPFAAENVSVTVVPSGEQILGKFPNYLMRLPPMPLDDPTYKPPAPPAQIPDVLPAQYFAYAGESSALPGAVQIDG